MKCLSSDRVKLVCPDSSASRSAAFLISVPFSGFSVSSHLRPNVSGGGAGGRDGDDNVVGLPPEASGLKHRPSDVRTNDDHVRCWILKPSSSSSVNSILPESSAFCNPSLKISMPLGPSEGCQCKPTFCTRRVLPACESSPSLPLSPPPSSALSSESGCNVWCLLRL